MSTNELHPEKTNDMAFAPSKDSDQPRHLPNLISLCSLHKEALAH